MKDQIHSVRGFARYGIVEEIRVDQFDGLRPQVRRKVFAAAAAEVVDHTHIGAAVHERVNKRRADK
jgi:hypothetical protein